MRWPGGLARRPCSRERHRGDSWRPDPGEGPCRARRDGESPGTIRGRVSGSERLGPAPPPGGGAQYPPGPAGPDSGRGQRLPGRARPGPGRAGVARPGPDRVGRGRAQRGDDPWAADPGRCGPLVGGPPARIGPRSAGLGGRSGPGRGGGSAGAPSSELTPGRLDGSRFPWPCSGGCCEAVRRPWCGGCPGWLVRLDSEPGRSVIHTRRPGAGRAAPG